MIRETLEECNSFKCAHTKLKYTPISALGYIIIAGLKGDEGVVISRNRYGAAHEDWLDSNNGTWYLV